MELLLDNIQRYFDFCIERHAIYVRREQGYDWPWTEDKILQTYKFTNCYRELDKGTIWLRRNIRSPFAMEPELFFNVAMYRSYNYWPFAELLLEEFGFIKDYPFVMTNLVTFAKDCKANGKQIFTGAHMITGNTKMGRTGKVSKIEQVFELQLGYLWEHRLEITPTPDDNLESAFNKLKPFPGYGPFITYEIITDLRHTRYLEHADDIMTWANPGPGATRGLMRLADMPIKGKKPKRDECIEVMRWLVVASLEYLPEWMEKWDARTCEHSLCEYDKYERVRLGQGRPRSKFIPPHLRGK